MGQGGCVEYEDCLERPSWSPAPIKLDIDGCWGPESRQGAGTSRFRSTSLGSSFCGPHAVALDRPLWSSHITFMALSRKKATTIALDPEDDRLLSRAAREHGVSRSEFVRQHLALVLEQYRRHPKPRSAGIV